MDVTKGKRNLQRQRDQRQHGAVSSMTTNPAHQPSPTTMLALERNIWQEARLWCVYGGGAGSSWYAMSLRSKLARKLIMRTLPSTRERGQRGRVVRHRDTRGRCPLRVIRYRFA